MYILDQIFQATFVGVETHGLAGSMGLHAMKRQTQIGFKVFVILATCITIRS